MLNLPKIKKTVLSMGITGIMAFGAGQSIASVTTISALEKPMYFDGMIYKQSEINFVFETLYQSLHANTSHIKVVDVVQIGTQYVGLLMQNTLNAEYHFIFTDGRIFFDHTNSPVHFINEDVYQRLTGIYQEALNLTHQNTEKPTGNVLNSALISLNDTDADNTQTLTSSQDAYTQYFYEGIKTLKPIFLNDYNPDYPDVLVLVSSTCAHCVRLIEDYKAKPEFYKGINFAFIPVGSLDDLNWTSFFGGEVLLEEQEISANNEFYLKTESLTSGLMGTPTYVWVSKTEGRPIRISGFVRGESFLKIKADAQSFKRTAHH